MYAIFWDYSEGKFGHRAADVWDIGELAFAISMTAVALPAIDSCLRAVELRTVGDTAIASCLVGGGLVIAFAPSNYLPHIGVFQVYAAIFAGMAVMFAAMRCAQRLIAKEPARHAP